MSANPLGDQARHLSIMLPSFNCAAYLREALASVLEQPGDALAGAQIMVVDDCSTRDDPESVVREMGAGRLAFFRQPRNLGACQNFNSCFDLAEREWIQILHADDYMLPGAYGEFAACLKKFPAALAVFARSQIVSAEGEFLLESPALGPEERGRLSYDPMMWIRNPIYPAGVLLNRRAKEEAGRFDCSFCHVNDWNYWWRLARTGECVYTRACIAAYRTSETGHSSSLVRSGKNVAEGLEQIERLRASLPSQFSERVAEHELYAGVFETAAVQCTRFLGEREPFMANWRYFSRMPLRFRWQKRRELWALRWRHLRKLFRQSRHFGRA